jgi:outer membrane protein TolC
LLKISQTRAEQVINRVKAGDLPPIDETEATQEVQRRLGGVVKAERDLQKSTFKLSLYLWTSRGIPAPLPAPAQVPETLPMPSGLLPFVVQNGVERALSQRPELENLDLAQALSQVDSNLAQNARRPNFDLYIAPGRDTGIDSIGATIKMGVTVSLPFGRRAAEAQLAQAELKLQKIDNERQLAEQRISVEVKDLANAVNTAYGRFLLAEKELELARVLEEGERRKFALGDSTLFLVNQRERASAEAEIKVIDIRAEYEQALAAFRVATVEY